jgi:putative transposase
MREVTYRAPEKAVLALGEAFRRFFDKKSRYPRFKKKGHRDAFVAAVSSDAPILTDGCRIRLPRVGWVRMCQALRFHGTPKSVTVSRTAGRWYASVLVEVEWTQPARESQAAVGVDLGVKALATLSTGEVIEGPKALAAELKRLRRLSRALSRKKKGSTNRRKAKARLARLHARIGNIRADALHKLTTRLARSFDVIGVETLNVRGMMANRCLSRAISDVGMYEFRRQLVYKADLYGARVVEADRWFPSSKTCSACGVLADDMPLSRREWTCPACGAHHDRDVNAAINLMQLATASLAGTHACGDRQSLALDVSARGGRSAKQESRMSRERRGRGEAAPARKHETGEKP